jgi:hypothetical protein
LDDIDGLWSLNRNLREIVGGMLDLAIKLASVVTHPTEIFFAGAGVDDEQVLIFGQAVNDNIVYESSLRIEQGRILRLSDGQLRSVVHREMLHGGKRFAAGQSDISHVADVKNTDAGADGHVLVDDAASDRSGVFDRHVPAVKLNHLRAHLAMDGVQGGLADCVASYGSGFDYGQENLG